MAWPTSSAEPRPPATPEPKPKALARLRSLLQRLAPCFVLDPRSLAAGRIALGALLLLDLAVRTLDLEAHYTDAGVLPREAMHLQAWDFIWSLHSLDGSLGFEAGLFGLTALAALSLLVGYRTFWVTLLLLGLELSMQGRNPLLRDGQDDLLRVLLFWSLFLPLGSRWSVDARRGRADVRSQLGPWPSVGLVLQVGLVYAVGALSKLQSPWWLEGQGIFEALNIGRYQTLLGQMLIQHPGPLVPLTYLVWIVEALGLPLLLCPPLAGKQRTLLVALFWGLHLGFGLGLRLGLFPYVGMAAWVFLLPAEFWNRWAPRFHWARTAIDPAEVGIGADPGRSPAIRRKRRAAEVAVGVGLVLMVQVNAWALWGGPAFLRPLIWCADAVGLQQYWSVFAPHAHSEAATTDFWLVADGEREDGSHLELLGENPELKWERPSLVSDQFPNRRWRHLLANLIVSWPKNTGLWDTVLRSRAGYVRWLCQSRGPLKKVRFWALKQPLGHTEEEATRVELAELRCPKP